jgi:hypothetical protein
MPGGVGGEEPQGSPYPDARDPAAGAVRDAQRHGDFVEIRLWGEERLGFLRRFLPYGERGLPSHDTSLNDVINALDADLFKACFATWVAALRDGAPHIIAIDGKTSRRSHARSRGREPLHMVSAWASRQRLVLGQEATDAKSNEITAIPLLLERLELTGALVTVDAIGAQTAIAETIVRPPMPISRPSSPRRPKPCSKRPTRQPTPTMAASNSAATSSATTSPGCSPTAAIPTSRASPIWP